LSIKDGILNKANIDTISYALLGKNCNLKHLGMSFRNTENVNIGSLANALKSDKCKLESLEIKNWSGKQGLEEIYDALQYSTSIKSLTILSFGKII
jgi:hypothetical protein